MSGNKETSVAGSIGLTETCNVLGLDSSGRIVERRGGALKHRGPHRGEMKAVQVRAIGGNQMLSPVSGADDPFPNDYETGAEVLRCRGSVCWARP